MAYAALVVSLLLFVVGLKRTGVLPMVAESLATARAAAQVVRSRELSDEQKQARVQHHAVEMMRTTLGILARLAIVCAVALTVVAAGSAIGLYTLEDAWDASIDPWFIAGSTILFVVIFVLKR
jgi:energy-converting hydrogenase Eha subunit G